MRDVFKEYRQGLLSWDEAFCIANNLAATACTEAVNDEIETEFYTKQMESLGVDAAEQIMKLVNLKGEVVIREFWEEISPCFVWDFIPFGFAYSCYKAWFRMNSPSGAVQGRNTFIRDLSAVAKALGGYEVYDKHHAIHWEQTNCYLPEPLILTFDLKEWMMPGYRGNDEDKLCSIVPKKTMCGLKKLADVSTYQAKE